jgi:hypothetical protein
MARGRSSMTSNYKKSPVEIRVKWKAGGSQGYFVYWDGEKEVELKELSFVVLEEGMKVSGYSQLNKDGIYSNAIQNLRNEPLKVRWQSDGSIIGEGLWADIKDDVKLKGGKYTAVIYALGTSKDVQAKMISIDLKSAASMPWSAVKNESNCFNEDVMIVWKGGYEEKTAGGNSYRVPEFEWKEVTNKKIMETAETGCDLLNEYLQSDVKEEEYGVDEEYQGHIDDLAHIDDASQLVTSWVIKVKEIADLDESVKVRILNTWQLKLDHLAPDTSEELSLDVDKEYKLEEDVPW